MKNILPVVSTMAFTEPYLRRLKLDQSVLGNTDKLGLLQTLHGSHLERIPFENTAQHGVVGGPASLDIQVTATKVLQHGRGGFCLELNLLFGTLLEDLGYSVTRVPAIVCSDGNFRDLPTHVVLIVSLNSDTDHETANKNETKLYLCDVGFGEPAYHPLLYEMDKEQVTPEGMCSRLSRDGDDVVLYWKKAGTWLPRLKWSYADSLLGDKGPSSADFAAALKAVQSEASPFARKLIVCTLTPEQKTSIAGNKVKITSNRFSPDETVTYETLASSEEVREKLLELFEYPLEASVGLDLTRSIEADADLWKQM